MKDGPNDRVNDSDSRLPSESSIHSSVTVDENDDFLALDTTPRVIDGEEFTVTKYPKRVETEEIKKDLQRWRLGGFVNKRPEQRKMSGPATSEEIRCRDFRKFGCPCYVQILRNATTSQTKVIMKADHNHDRMEPPKAGLDDGMKMDVERLYKKGETVGSICRELNVFDKSTRKKIKIYCQNHRKEMLGIKGEVVTERGWLDAFEQYFPEKLEEKFPRRLLLGGGFFSSKEHEHKPFVLAFQFPDDEKDLVIAFSTPSLMKNMVKTFEKGLRVIQMDGTHKLNNKGYPVVIVGTTDRDHQFFPAVFVVTKSEKEESFAVVARAIEEHCAKHFKREYKSCTILNPSDILNRMNPVFKGSYVVFCR